MPQKLEKGIIHFFPVILLFIALAFGLYLVQTQTNLLPSANTDLPISAPVGSTPATLGVYPNNLPAGSSTTVTWTKVSNPTVKDWISVNKASNGQRVDWFFTNSCTQTAGTETKSEASCNYNVSSSQQPGEYDLGLFANNSNDILLAKTTIQVKSPDFDTSVSLSVDKSIVSPSDNIGVQWNGLTTPEAKDWIALYKQGSPDKAYRHWIFIGTCSRSVGNLPAASGNCNLQIPSNTANGAYEVRLFTNNSYKRLNTSSVFEVNSNPPPSPSPSPVATHKRVFVTSTTYDGNLGSWIGADQKCQDRANAANLNGSWKAWISDYSNSTLPISARERLAHSTLPYKLLDDTLIANNWDDLTDGSLQNPINITELGSQKINQVWTGTHANGSTYIDPGRDNCGNWSRLTGSGMTGGSARTNGQWTTETVLTCNPTPLGVAFSLYCFEQ